MCRPQNNVPTLPIDPFGRTSVTNRLSNSLFDRTSCVCAASSSGLTPGNMLLFALRQLTRVTVPLLYFYAVLPPVLFSVGLLSSYFCVVGCLLTTEFTLYQFTGLVGLCFLLQLKCAVYI